VQGWQKKKV